MHPIILYCKSYREDALRARKLVESAQRHNRDQLPVYISAPQQDMALFRETLAGLPHTLVCDDDIIRANPRLDLAMVNQMRGYLSQQVVKSEFWRLGLCENYVCLDSDSYFIRDFTARDFLAPGGIPYTVMHEAKEFLQYMTNIRKTRVIEAIREDRRAFSRMFPEADPRYLCPVPPAIWSRRVWLDLDEKYLQPRGMNFADAINQYPSELNWYGGSYLSYRPFPLFPREPLFRVYGYIEEYWRNRWLGETDENLTDNFIGVVAQSAWNKDLDYDRIKVIRRKLRSGLKYVFGRW